MITFFTLPKPFAGHIGVIQRNAIESWVRLRPACEVLLMGKDAGVAETAAALGVQHLPDVACNEFGTPLLDSAFRLAAEQAKFPLLCYVNADIMLTSELPEAAARVKKPRFVMVGQRWDIDITTPWDFSGDDWENRLKELIKADGKLHPAAGSDYFLFRRGDAIGNLPPLAVGRQGWDNWFLWNARRRKVPIIDATPVTTVIHQNHDYRHVPRGQGNSYAGPESARNLSLIGDIGINYTIEDANCLLTRGGLRPAWQRHHLRRRWERMVVERAWPAKIWLLAKVVGSRAKRVFVPYPEGYRPPSFREQLAEVFRGKQGGAEGDGDKH